MQHPEVELLAFIISNLTTGETSDHFTVERSIDEKGVFLLVTIDKEYAGRVIGSRGSTAQSMRTILRALGTKNNARYNLKIEVREG